MPTPSSVPGRSSEADSRAATMSMRFRRTLSRRAVGAGGETPTTPCFSHGSAAILELGENRTGHRVFLSGLQGPTSYIATVVDWEPQRAIPIGSPRRRQGDGDSPFIS